MRQCEKCGAENEHVKGLYLYYPGPGPVVWCEGCHEEWLRGQAMNAWMMARRAAAERAERRLHNESNYNLATAGIPACLWR